MRKFQEEELVDDECSMSSGLALVPLVRCPNYSATKAALHHWILCLREQLKGSKVKVVEMLPPAVQSTWSIFIRLDAETDESHSGVI